MQQAAAALPPESDGLRALGWRAVAIVLTIVAVMAFGYHAIGNWVDPRRAVSLATPLDRAIPLLPAAIFAYSMVYSSSLYPLFAIRSGRLFLRVAKANAALLALSFAIYLAFPVTAVDLRADVSGLDVTRFAQWGVRTTYAVDPPTNCFPSLHLAFATLSMLCAGSARPLWGWVALPLVVGIAVSILTMKQHFIADGVAGVLLAWAVWRWLVAPDRLERPAGE